MTRKIRILLLAITIVIIALCVIVIYKGEIFSFLKKTFFKETYQLEYFNEVKNASLEFGVPEDLIYAIIKTESDFKPKAESKAGAIGLMQLMPDTYSWIAMRLGEKENKDMIYDVSTNIRYGTYYLKFLTERLENDESIYAAYNAGYSRVSGWLSDSRYSSDGKRLDNIPYKETSSYVKKVSEAREAYKKILSESESSSENK
jgi:soluble lytic murein transglycosylase